MDELQIYAQGGLFHSIVKASKIMNGRYQILKNGAELNNNNVLSGIDFPPDDGNFPGVFCLPPISTVETARGGLWENFRFRLFFLCTTNYTGDNQIKFRDPNTNRSLHKISWDWSDMKTVAMNFINALERLQGKTGIIGQWRLNQGDKIQILRLSNLHNKNLSGVMIEFYGGIPTSCEYTDIPIDNISF